jgi:hypothetical protein
VQTEGGTAVAVCQQPPEALGAKFLGVLPPTAISLVALVISVLAYRYNRSKDARAREQSIEDDFWLRKVVSPMSIEPFLKHMQQAAATLPRATGATPDAVKQFWKAQIDKFEELTMAFQTLGLIDEALGSSVMSAIEPLEEEFATYCGALCEYLEGGKPGAPDRAAAVSRLTTNTISVLKLVKVHQKRVGQRG